MCGINALLDAETPASAREATVSAMNDELAYRGPDGEGLVSMGPVTLGMRRLSIIDLESGQQPLFNEDHTIALVCNGEIYNHVELRAELISRGHRFATGSDCETILHLYEDYGERCVGALRGMFAFALWDARRSLLLAARDRLGIKPLYLARNGRRIALSSELKTIVRAGLASDTVDHDVLYRTLRHTYPIDESKTVARDVERLAAGELLVADVHGVRRERYWVPTFGPSSLSGPQRAPEPSDEEVRSVLEESVALHLRSDVPIAVLLSAGIDSAAIAAIARSRASDLVGIVIGYAGAHDCDERKEAQATARALGIKCLEVELDASHFSADFRDLVRRCDEPPCDLASMAQWSLYGACRALGYKVVLSGIGGDEIFFGYPGLNAVGVTMASRDPRIAHPPRVLAEGIERIGRLAPRLRRGLGPAWPGPWTGFEQATLRTHESVLRFLGADPGAARSTSTDAILMAYEDRAAPGPDAIYAFMTGAYLPNNGFQLADKLGMGNSIEVRVPFADHVLFDKVTSLPLARRFSAHESKPLLKRLIAPLLPADVIRRPKRGFTPPSSFIRAIIREHADAVLSSPVLRDFIDVDRLCVLIDEYFAAPTHPENRRFRVMRRATALARDFDARGIEWFLFSLTAFTASRASWERGGSTSLGNIHPPRQRVDDRLPAARAMS